MEALVAVLIAAAAGVGFLIARSRVTPAPVSTSSTIASPTSPALALPPKGATPALALPDYVTRDLLGASMTALGAQGDGSVASGCAAGSFSATTGPCIDPISNPHPNPDSPVGTGSNASFGVRAGVASSVAHQWCLDVAAGDTAGRIAEEITGDRARYVELLSANPGKAQVHSPELNFQALCAGERLYLPKTWNPWVDQRGTPSGKRGALPPYDKLPTYPSPDVSRPSMGRVPWPAAAPTSWKAVEEIVGEFITPR